MIMDYMTATTKKALDEMTKGMRPEDLKKVAEIFRQMARSMRASAAQHENKANELEALAEERNKEMVSQSLPGDIYSGRIS